MWTLDTRSKKPVFELASTLLFLSSMNTHMQQHKHTN